MTNIIAYIPVINQPYLTWLWRHEDCNIFLITDSLAREFNPAIERNLISIPAVLVADLIRHACPSVINVIPFSDPEDNYLKLFWLKWETIIMPNDDVCHAFAERYLISQGYKVEFEEVWGRWDMIAVKRHEPVIGGVEISTDSLHFARIQDAIKVGKKSPDWWRQVGLVAYRGDEFIGSAYNGHYPTEYEAAIFGDPRLNFNAGEGRDVYLSLHAERSHISGAARRGTPLEGTSIFINVFPCADCCRWIIVAGIKEVFFYEGYSAIGGLRSLQAAGIRIVQVKNPESA